jgi:hypothetical protein
VIVIEEPGFGRPVLMGKRSALEEQCEQGEEEDAPQADAGDVPLHRCGEDTATAIDSQLIPSRHFRGAGGETENAKLASTMWPSTDSTR